MALQQAVRVNSGLALRIAESRIAFCIAAGQLTTTREGSSLSSELLAYVFEKRVERSLRSIRVLRLLLRLFLDALLRSTHRTEVRADRLLGGVRKRESHVDNRRPTFGPVVFCVPDAAHASARAGTVRARQQHVCERLGVRTAALSGVMSPAVLGSGSSSVGILTTFTSVMLSMCSRAEHDSATVSFYAGSAEMTALYAHCVGDSRLAAPCCRTQ